MILLEHNTFYLRDGVPFVRARMGGGNYTEKDDTIPPAGLKSTKQPTAPDVESFSIRGGFLRILPVRAGFAQMSNVW